MNETHQRFDEHCDRMRFTGNFFWSESAAAERKMKLKKKDTKMRLRQSTECFKQLKLFDVAAARLPCVA